MAAIIPDLAPELLEKILLKLESNQEVIDKSRVSKTWHDVINRSDFFEQRPRQSLTILLPNLLNQEQVTANPLCLLRHLEKSSINLRNWRPANEFELETPNKAGCLLALESLDSGYLLRVFQNCFCLTYLRSIDPNQETVTQFFSSPIKSLIKSCTSNKALLIFKDNNKPIKMIEFKTNAQEKVVAINLPSDITLAALSVRGDYLMTMNNNNVINFWDLNQTKISSLPLTSPFKPGCSLTFFFSPNNTHLIIISDEKLSIWDYSKGFPQPVEINHSNAPDKFKTYKAFFSLDGNKAMVMDLEYKYFLIDLTANILSFQKLSLSVSRFPFWGGFIAANDCYFRSLNESYTLNTKFGQMVYADKRGKYPLKCRLNDYWPATNKFNFKQA